MPKIDDKSNLIVIFFGPKSYDLITPVVLAFRQFNSPCKIAVVTPLKKLPNECEVDFFINDLDFYFINKTFFEKKFGSRSGWYIQQIMKLTVPFLIKRAEKYNYVIWDGDTVPLKKIIFFKNGYPVINLSRTEYHWPYFYNNRIILGGDFRLPFSSISQYMPFTFNEWLKLIGIKKNDHTVSRYQVKEFIFSLINSIKIVDGFSDFSEQEFFVSWRIKNNIPFNTTFFKIIRYGSLLPGALSFKLWLARSLGAINISFEKRAKTSFRDFFRAIGDFLR
jgi:hypothetical protein